MLTASTSSGNPCAAHASGHLDDSCSDWLIHTACVAPKGGRRNIGTHGRDHWNLHAGVLEVVEDHDGDTFRAVYTVKFASAVYVLHAFQKKSKSGIKTPQTDIDLIKQRLKLAEQMHKQGKGEK